jgi:hypothetical protein
MRAARGPSDARLRRIAALTPEQLAYFAATYPGQNWQRGLRLWNQKDFNLAVQKARLWAMQQDLIGVSLKQAVGRRGGLQEHRTAVHLRKRIAKLRQRLGLPEPPAPPAHTGSALFLGPDKYIVCRDHVPKPEDRPPGALYRELSREEVARLALEQGEPVVCEEWASH